MPSHGISRYRNGCRCGTCREANAGRVRRNRERRVSDPSRLSHGTRSAYDAGCRCDTCVDERRIAYLSREGGYRAHHWREFVTNLYWEQKHLRESLRESGRTITGVAGTSGSITTCAQLEDADFDLHFPQITFRDHLVSLSGWATTPAPR